MESKAVSHGVSSCHSSTARIYMMEALDKGYERFHLEHGRPPYKPDEEQIGYLTGVLGNFFLAEEKLNLPEGEGPQDTMVQFVGRMERGGRKLSREDWRKAGDRSLVLAGLFPEYLERHRLLGLYMELGEKGYAMMLDVFPPTSVFGFLSHYFDDFSEGLTYVRDNFMRLDITPEGKLRIVPDYERRGSRVVWHVGGKKEFYIDCPDFEKRLDSVAQHLDFNKVLMPIAPQPRPPSSGN